MERREDKLKAFRGKKDQFLREDPQSPLKEAARKNFNGLIYYPLDLKYAMVSSIERYPIEPKPLYVNLPTSRSTVTDRWSQLRDQVKTAYEGGLLKKGVAADEVDAILRQYDAEPVNFTPQAGSLWAGFKIDDRFGQRRSGNVPAELVRPSCTTTADPVT